ncbi:MAG: O-antigen ligase family protein [Proteobacteria bacterium]|nr:O-antigen ligase family protein [Pseudomonadota bacterium]
MNRAKVSRFFSFWFGLSGLLAFVGLYFSISLMWIGLVFFFLSGLSLAISSQNWNWLSRNPLFAPMMVLAVSMCASIVLAPPYPFKVALGKITLPLVTFLFAWLFSRQRKAQRILLQISIFLSFLFSLISVSQGIGLFQTYLPGLNPYLYPLPHDSNLYLAVGFTRHHTTFGFTLLFLFHVLFAHGVLANEPREKVLFFLASVASVIGILFTFSRGVWLSLILSSCLVLVLVNWKRLLFMLVGLTGVLTTAFLTIPAFQTRVASFRLAENQERFALWSVCWKMFQSSPWFGQGYDSFGYRFPLFSDLHLSSPSTPLDPHNMYLEFLATSGIFGFLCFLFFLGSCFRFVLGGAKKSDSLPRKAWFLASVGVLSSFSVGGFFDRYFDMPHTLVPTLLLLGLCTAARLDETVADL